MTHPVPTSTVRLEQMFARQAALSPTAPAIFFRGQVITYGELAADVDRLSRDLAAQGVAPGVVVALCLARTPAMVAVILAALRAAGAYLPLDLRNPPERMQFILSDSRASLLLVDQASPAFPDFAGNVLELADRRIRLRQGRSVPTPSGPAELAYVIYTSGSTGAPKGVMLGHGATHLVDWARRTFSSDDLSRVAATTSICFDPSVFEIFVPLCTGGAVILKENGLEAFGPDEQPTMLNSVPSVLAELCRSNAIPDSVRVLNVGGEALPSELAREVYIGRSAMTLYNHYGPTEATTCATVGRVPRSLAGAPSIGRAVRGAEIMLLDPSGQDVSDGQTGEIHIGGAGLALGYLNRPELTADRFIDSPKGRVYRTGDLGYWREGRLYFAGRVDQQVKIRGFRVELGEIEAALLRLAPVDKALVVVRKTAGRPHLIGYIQSPEALAPAQVRRDLAAWLPDYMIPASIMVMPAFPLLVSGKVDHAALPKPGASTDLAPSAVSNAERPIIHVFEEVLGQPMVGPNDSFFDLGGDSLSSVHAALRLGEIFGHEVPAALIHQSPTPHQLARSLKHARVRADKHVSLLQSGGSGSPLFCMADIFGHAFNYLSLARRLAPDRAVYSVVPGPLQAAFTRERDIVRLTVGYIAEMRRIQAQGPYFIAGFSAGGTLALDVASALERDGERVCLILLDSHLQPLPPTVGALALWTLRQARTLVTARPATVPARAADGFLPNLLRQIAPGAAPTWVPRSQAAFATSMIRAAAAYRPGNFHGPTLTINAADQAPIDDLFGARKPRGWLTVLKGQVTEVSVAGGHHQFLREPLVSESAAAVSRFLLAHDQASDACQTRDIA